MNQKVEIVENICSALLSNDKQGARRIAIQSYPIVPFRPRRANIPLRDAMRVFVRDGFVDRYSGRKLVFPGILRLLSMSIPEEWPFHKNWKMSETHMSYWELTPTIDHVIPLARGGNDIDTNRVTTSMLMNSAKAHWMLHELGWSLHEPGDFRRWDGLTSRFVELVERDPSLLKEKSVRRWYNVVRQIGVAA
jgi:hypothetical protein